MATSAQFTGDELEYAVAKVLGGTVKGGFGDGGRDVIVPEIGGVQVKNSSVGAMAFLKTSLQKHEFIPMVVGEPGTKHEMLDSLKRFGAWAGNDVPNRVAFLSGVLQVRNMIHSGSYAR